MALAWLPDRLKETVQFGVYGFGDYVGLGLRRLALFRETFAGFSFVVSNKAIGFFKLVLCAVKAPFLLAESDANAGGPTFKLN